MKTITSEVITNILDKMGVSYKVLKPRSGEFGRLDTLFMIRNKHSLVYITDFSIELEGSIYSISGDMFFLTPNGTLSGDWIKVCEADFIVSDYDDIFMITTDDDFDFMVLDEHVREYMGIEDPKVEKLTIESFDEINGRPLSDFLKSNIEIL